MAIENAVEVHETERVYTYPGGDKVILRNVVELAVRPSGDHRVKTQRPGGIVHLHIIAPGWLHVEIIPESGDWTL